MSNKRGDAKDDAAADDDDKKKKDNAILLYQRDSNRTTWIAFSFRLSIVHSFYWAWYCFDFVPTINAGTASQLHIDPMLGVVGLTFAVVVNAGTILYPLRLLSRLELQPKDKANKKAAFRLYTHTLLPLVTHSKNPTAVVEVGRLSLDTRAVESRPLLDNDVLNAKGHIPLMEKRDSHSWLSNLPFLMDVKPNEIVLEDADQMVQALVDPGPYLRRSKNKPHDPRNTSSARSRKKFRTKVEDARPRTLQFPSKRR